MPVHNIPTINLLCMETKYITAFNNALNTHWRSFHDNNNNNSTPKLQINIIDTSLRNVPTTTKFDLVVSPANSYGLLDGAFDDAISRVFCANRGLPYETLTHAAQDVLYEKWRGFAPPGSCTLVRFPGSMLKTGGEEGAREEGDNPWGCKWVGICPTMRLPGKVEWDREIVYECVWSLLCEVEGWNRRYEQQKQGSGSGSGSGSRSGPGAAADRIDSLLITPLATGIGKVTKERWAAQMVMALKHFVDAIERPERWGRLTWMELDEAMEVSRTY